MKSPLTGKEMLLKRESRVLTFRKEEFSVVYHYYLCDQSGEAFTSTELDQINMQQLHNQYLQQHNLPFPEEIKQVRENYGLSATKMSEIFFSDGSCSIVTFLPFSSQQQVRVLVAVVVGRPERRDYQTTCVQLMHKQFLSCKY